MKLGNVVRGVESSNVYKYMIKERYKHPEFSATSIDNDIALFELEGNVQFNSYVVPICLPYHDEKSDEAIATGWGSTGFGDGLTKKLMKVQLNIFKEKECQDQYPVHGKVKRLIDYDSKVCAGSYTENKDTCKFDF